MKGFKDFDYQVIFAHCKLFERHPVSKEFVFPNNMKTWVNKAGKQEDLDSELDLYYDTHVKNKK